MLTPEMQNLIRNHTAGMVASTNGDGTPAVSPKATFVVLDERTLAYGDIRSPGTARNLMARPAVEAVFIDVVLRKAVRVAGTAEIVPKAAADAALLAAFQATWPTFLDVMQRFVKLRVTAASMILSPAYDRGATAGDLAAANLARLTGLYGDLE